MAEKEYLYCSRDLHSEPEKYFYSKAGGAPYLKSFLNLRKNKILEIKNLLGTAIPLPILASKYPMFSKLCQVEKKLKKWLDFIPPAEEVTIEEFPHNCQRFPSSKIISLSIQNFLNEQTTKAKQDLDNLIKKFEVFRRIQSAYDENFRKVGNDFDNMALYAYFSLALVLSFSNANSLKALNTALKVNDMLTSRSFKHEKPEAMVLTCAALDLERNTIFNLSKKHGLNP